MPQQRTYPPAPFGLGTSFPEVARPPLYATVLENRFVNPGGGLEKRQGLVTVATIVSNASDNRELQSLHEFLLPRGTAKFYTQVSAAALTLLSGNPVCARTVFTQWNACARFQSIQFDDKFILVNGTNRPVFSTDGSAFADLQPLLEEGAVHSTADATAQDRLKDVDIADWVANTDVAINDLLFDATVSSYALITNVLVSSLVHTALSAAAVGAASGTGAKGGGDRYRLFDLIENNVIPYQGISDDNVATTTAVTNGSTMHIASPIAAGRLAFTSGVAAQLRIGDWLSNTTRNQVARITGISGNQIQHSQIAGQAAGDSIVFLKSAVPIASRAHVHFGRGYFVDARDRRKIRITGPGDIQDFTTEAGTLDSTTFKFGAQQPEGDTVQTLGSFQQWIVIGGKRYVFLYSGLNPIQDLGTQVSAGGTNFAPQGLFPRGVLAPNALQTIGNDIVYLSPTGVEAASLDNTLFVPTRKNLSEAIRTDLLTGVSAGVADDDVQVVNYPRRNWLLVKLNERLFCFNYGPSLSEAALGLPGGDASQKGKHGSWSEFTGVLADQNDYFVRQDGRLYTCDSSGHVFRFDDEGVFRDGGRGTYRTRYQTAWLPLDENKQQPQGSRKVKHGPWINLTTQGSANQVYTVRVTGDYGGESGETATITASASNDPLQPLKIAIPWAGERVRLMVETSSSAGPDILTEQTFAFSRDGAR